MNFSKAKKRKKSVLLRLSGFDKRIKLNNKSLLLNVSIHFLKFLHFVFEKTFIQSYFIVNHLQCQCLADHKPTINQGICNKILNIH